jgi:tetratricopeptide (TPR) repeat protein
LKIGTVWTFAAVAALAVVAFGCAKDRPTPKAALAASPQVAYSVDGARDTFAVDASRAGRTLRLIPRVGTVTAILVDEMVDDPFRVAVREALGDYDPGQVFTQHLEDRLQEEVPGEVSQVSPLTSTAGFHSRRDAQEARFANIAERGIDLLLEVDAEYGLYDPTFQLHLNLRAVLRQMPKGSALYRDVVSVTDGPLLANAEFTNLFSERLKGLTDPTFGVAEENLQQLIEDDAEPLKADFERAVDAAVAALLTDLGVDASGIGYYHLGRTAFADKDFEEAEELFRKALSMGDPSPHTMNDLSVAIAWQDRTDEAVKMGKELIAEYPGYGPAAFNLAYWYGVELEDYEAAKPYYLRAVSMGMPKIRALERKLEM